MDERVRRWSSFYTTPTLPQAHSHCMRAVIFQQTHLQSKIFHLMPQVVFCFPSPLPVHFLISDVPIMFCRRLSSSRMTDPMISQDGSWHYHQKRYHQVQEGHVQMYDMNLGNVAMFLSNPITERFDFPSANAGVCPGYTKAPVPNDMIYPSPSILYRFTWKSHPLPWLSLGVSYHCLKSS